VALTRIRSERESFYCAYAKRIIDILASAFFLFCCLPLLFLAAVLIVFDSQGAPFFRQRRIGKDGCHFVLYKLKTMSEGAEDKGFRTESQDARITRVGTLLRDSKIDEIPQLWNVLIGEMSLIGPRPLSVKETEYLLQSKQFSPDEPGFVPSVRPGMTGWEQCTRSSFHPYLHRFQMNDYYESNLSLWLDCWVIKRTFAVCPIACFMISLSITGLITSASFFLCH
jgi:lipopolysaccharide/colanic/teichoic acid biosynthesis glycosyltransferase